MNKKVFAGVSDICVSWLKWELIALAASLVLFILGANPLQFIIAASIPNTVLHLFVFLVYIFWTYEKRGRKHEF